MSPVNMFNAVTEKGSYIVGYIMDGWTREIIISASRPAEAMLKTQDQLGDICRVTFVEKSIY